MSLRICSTLPAASERRELCSEVLDRSVDLGLRGVELKLGESDLISVGMRKWLAEELPSYDLEVYTHLPYLQGEKNLASPDDDLGRSALGVITESLRFSRDLGCTKVNTHLGVGIGGGHPIARAANRLIEVERIARDLGIDVCVENQESSCGGILNTPEDIRTFLEIHPSAALTYDPGHGNTHGKGVADFLPVMLPRLQYLHLHDNDGFRDQHRSLGEGTVDFHMLLDALAGAANYRGSIPAVMELRVPDPGPSYHYLRIHSREGLLELSGDENGRA